MTKSADDKVLTDELAQLSERYRQAATESTPEWLDNAVLKRAGADAGQSIFAWRFSAWLRPLAFAATAVLCLSLVFEFGQTPGIVDSNGIIGGTSPSSGFADPVTGTDAVEALNRAVEASGRRLEDLNRSAESVKPANSTRYCTEQQSADPAEWWRCIEELRMAGMTANAQSELALLEARFPDFSPPR